jgi:hypothetical protein
MLASRVSLYPRMQTIEADYLVAPAADCSPKIAPPETKSAWLGSDSYQIGGRASAVGGSRFGRWVGCEAAVGGDVGEDLLDQGEHVGVLDGVDMVAPSRRALIRPARRSLLRCWLMVATPTTILMPRWWVSGRDTIA